MYLFPTRFIAQVPPFKAFHPLKDPYALGMETPPACPTPSTSVFRIVYSFRVFPALYRFLGIPYRFYLLIAFLSEAFSRPFMVPPRTMEF